MKIFNPFTGGATEVPKDNLKPAEELHAETMQFLRPSDHQKLVYILEKLDSLGADYEITHEGITYTRKGGKPKEK